MNAHAITVQSGELVALRLFDIAYSIDLARSESLWAAHVGGATSRTHLSSTPTKAIAFDIPPLRLSLGTDALMLGAQKVTAEISVRLYDFGVAALAVRVAVTNIAWDAFVTQFNAMPNRDSGLRCSIAYVR
jgi:hypothetical protein